MLILIFHLYIYFQNQLKELQKITSEEKAILENDLTTKDYLIQHLQREVDEGIKKQIEIQEMFNDEISKLNNVINELEQQVNDHKIKHEENLTMQQYLTDKTDLLENRIKQMDEEMHKLREDLNKEQNSKLKMKEDYENHSMKLKEKILNRNNELVELQNNILRNSEVIESLNVDLRNQKAITDDIQFKYINDIKKLNDDNESLKTEISTLQEQLTDKIRSLEITKETLTELETSKNKLLEEFEVLTKVKLGMEKQMTEKNTYLESLENEVKRLSNENIEVKHKFETELMEKEYDFNCMNEKYNEEYNLRINCENIMKTLEDNLKRHETDSNIKQAELCEKINEKDNVIAIHMETLAQQKIMLQKLETQLTDNIKQSELMQNEIKKLAEFSIEEKQKFETILLEKDSYLKTINEKYNEENKLRIQSENMIKILDENFNKVTMENNNKNSELEEKINERDNIITVHLKTISEKDSLLQELENQLKYKNTCLESLQIEVKNLSDQYNESVQNFEGQLIEKDLEMKCINEKYNKEMNLRICSEDIIKTLNESLDKHKVESNHKESELCEKINKKDNIITTQTKTLVEKEVILEKLKTENDEKDSLINSIRDNLVKEMSNQAELQKHIDSLCLEKEDLMKVIVEKECLYDKLLEENNKLEIGNENFHLTLFKIF